MTSQARLVDRITTPAEEFVTTGFSDAATPVLELLPVYWSYTVLSPATAVCSIWRSYLPAISLLAHCFNILYHDNLDYVHTSGDHICQTLLL
jgi:hypothetical protein